MFLSTAKQRFHDGAITKIIATRAILEDGWYIELITKDGEQIYIHTSKGEPKVYLKSDSLLNDVARIKDTAITSFSF